MRSQHPSHGKRTVTKARQPSTADAHTMDDDPLCGLTPREATFIELYLATYRVGQSYIEAGFEVANMATACAAGSRLLNHVKSARYRSKRLRELMRRNEDAQDRLLRMFVDMAYADPRELTEMRVGNCRHCHGIDHKYQFTPQEYADHEREHEIAVLKARTEEQPEPEFDPMGGVGFRRNREPHPECPECDGEGVSRVVFKDTRNLSPAAVALFAGAEITKDGKKVKIHDQKAARDVLAKLLKMYDDRSVVEVKFDPAELEAKFGEKMRAAHANMAAMRADRLGSRDSRES